MSELERDVDDAERAARRVTRSRTAGAVARSGYVASALLRVMIGVLALLLAARVDGADPGTSGAFGAIAAVPGGVVLLGVIAGCNAALFLWLVVQGVAVQGDAFLERWRQRLVAWGRGAVYGVIGLAALRFALGAHAVDADQQRAGAAQLLEVPGGRWAIALVGAVVVIVGVSMVWLGITRRFLKTIHLPSDHRFRGLVVVVGVVAYLAQGATILLVGGSLLVAAWTVDADRVGGLDSALTGFASSLFGQVLLVAIGAGWILAGLYALLRAGLART